MTDYDAVIIGAGIGGLTAGALLTKQGQKVLILEQHRIPGGYCSSFRRKGYDFDAGVHYIGNVEGENAYVGQIINYLGLQNDITFLELDPDCFNKLIFPDFAFSVPKGLDKYRARIEAAFPGESNGIDEYFKVLSSISKEIQKLSSNPSTKGYNYFQLKYKKALKWANKPLQELLDACTKNIKLQAVLAGQYLSYGEPPASASILVHTMVLLQYLSGAYYPRGGSQKLPSGIARYIVTNGGEIRYHTPVKNILLKSKKAYGVSTIEGEEIVSKKVISDADTWETFYNLAGENKFSQKWQTKMGKYTPSVSVLSVYLGLKTDLKEKGIRASNYLMFDNYNFNETFQKLDTEILPDGFPLFVTSPTVKDDSGELAPAGCHILELFTLVQFKHFEKWKNEVVMKRGKDYTEFKSILADRLIDRAEKLIPDLHKYVEVVEIATPLTYTSYLRVKNGASFGFRKTPEQSGRNAMAVKTPMANLYLTGANTVGLGVAGTMLSGLYCADLITGGDLIDKVCKKS